MKNKDIKYKRNTIENTNETNRQTLFLEIQVTHKQQFNTKILIVKTSSNNFRHKNSLWNLRIEIIQELWNVLWSSDWHIGHEFKWSLVWIHLIASFLITLVNEFFISFNWMWTWWLLQFHSMNLFILPLEIRKTLACS